jgi:hypothetical protein
MREINPEYLASQLQELSEWADYLHLSLTMDRPFERGKIQLLESLASAKELTQLRFELRTVRYRLENLCANLPSSKEALNSGSPGGQEELPTPSWCGGWPAGH